MSVLQVDDLFITYHTSGGGVLAVRGENLTVDKGEVLGLAGESGCGKSTIAGGILRLLPTSTKIGGQILLEGEDVLAMVTRAPATTLGMIDRLGTLVVGSEADVTILRLEEGRFDLVDSAGDVRVGRERLVPVAVIKTGVQGAIEPLVSEPPAGVSPG